MKLFTRFYRRGLTLFWTAATIILVLLAVLAGLAELLLPYTSRYQSEIEARLSEYAGQSVKFDTIAGSWDVTGPQFTLERLAIYAPGRNQSKPALLINQAKVKFSLLDYLRPNKPFAQFQIVGAELEIIRDSNGVLKLSGLHSEKPMALDDVLKLLSAAEHLHLSDTHLSLHDELSGFKEDINATTAEIHYQDGLFRASWQATLGKAETAFNFLNTDQNGKVDGLLSLRLDQSKPQSLNIWTRLHITQPGQLLELLPEQWRNTASGVIDTEAWLEWQTGADVQIQGKLAARDLRWKMQHDDHLNQLDKLSMDWRVGINDKQHWTLSLVNIVALAAGKTEWEGPVVLARNADEHSGFYMQTGFLDLAFAHSLLMPIAREFELKLPVTGPLTGQLQNLVLATDATGQVNWLLAEASNVSIAAVADKVGMGPFNVSAHYQNDTGRVEIAADDFSFEWNRVFALPQQWEHFACTFDIHREAVLHALIRTASYQFQTQLCELENRDMALLLDLSLLLPAQKTVGSIITPGPFVDAAITVKHLQASSLNKYWPEKYMKKKGLRWLKQAFSEGEIEMGQVQVVGDLGKFPFRQGGGRFSAWLPAKNMSLSLHPKWPRLTHTRANIELNKLRLLINSSSLQTGGLELKGAHAVVDMSSRVKITADFKKNTDATKLLEYIHRSPLEEIMGLQLSAFQLSGPVTADGHLSFKMDGRKDWFDVKGRVKLKDINLELPDWKINLNKINGYLDWSEHGISASNVDASLNGVAGILDIKAGPEQADGQVLKASLNLVSPVEKLFPAELVKEFAFSQYFQGATGWNVGVNILQKQADGVLPLSLDIRSDLFGLQSSLPAPLAKSATEIWPLVMHLPIQGADQQLKLEIDNRLGLKLALDPSRKQAMAVQVLLGDEMVSDPRRGYFSLGGIVQSFDLDGWVALLAGTDDNSQSSALSLANFAIEAHELNFLGANIADTQFELKRSDESYEAVFSGPSIDGKIRLPGGNRKALVADFNRLLLPVVDEAENINTDKKSLDLNPAGLPPMHLYARQFAWGHLKLSETRIETHALDNGIAFDSLEGVSGSVHLRGSGDWLNTAEGQHTSFKADITAESFDEIVDAMDFSAGITGGQSIINLSLNWAGSPLDIDLFSLAGSADIQVKDGSLVDADPGAGRLLSLISLQALPRRLMLDFRDVFTQGFQFDSASGHFEIANGISFTDDVKIKSAAADILITGSTNIPKREYDQTIEVRPGVGSALPVIGAIAAGPGGAAAGLALQGIFKKALGEATAVVYKVSGSWDKPVLTKLEKQAKSRNKAAKPVAKTRKTRVRKTHK